jgi:hypothetical protein
MVIVNTAETQILSPIEATMICILENPYFNSASRRVELRRAAENFQEDRLHQVFCLTRVPKDPQGNVQHQAMVPIEENREGIVVAVSQTLHQDFIRQLYKLRVKRELAPPARHRVQTRLGVQTHDNCRRRSLRLALLFTTFAPEPQEIVKKNLHLEVAQIAMLICNL